MTKPFEIYQAKKLWLNCPDARPWLIIDIRQGEYGCFPISGNCYGGGCFSIDSSDPDFVATGLTKSCFVHETHIIELQASDFLHRRGLLTGNLLANFRKHAGV